MDPVTDLLSVWRVEDGHLLLQMIGLDFSKPSVWVLLNENPHPQRKATIIIAFDNNIFLNHVLDLTEYLF